MAEGTRLHLNEVWNKETTKQTSHVCDQAWHDGAQEILDEESSMRDALHRLGKEEQASSGAEVSPRPPVTLIRRRFVRDGDVAVTVVRRAQGLKPSAYASGPASDQRQVAEAALAEERAKRMDLQQSLDKANATIRNLQTKLGHAEVARDEAVSALEEERARMKSACEERVPTSRKRASQAPEKPITSMRRARGAANAKERELNARWARSHKSLVDALSQEMSTSLQHDPSSAKAEPVKWWLQKKPKHRR